MSNVSRKKDECPQYSYNGGNLVIYSIMRKYILWLAALLASILFSLNTGGVSEALHSSRGNSSEAYELIAEVNSLRSANGLPAYNIHPILMQIAQAHANYQASIGTVTHYSADGSRPFQRALAAGYPVAGDLSLGGFFSENIQMGYQLTPEEAITAWRGDSVHLNTMLHPTNYRDVGAGVAYDGNYVYYTLDVGQPSDSMPVYTPSGAGMTPGAAVYPSLAPVIINTPLADGSIIHVVQPGETLWTIAVAYRVTVDELRFLNTLALSAIIYPGDKLTIRLALTATPQTPTATSTRRPTATIFPSVTAARATFTPMRVPAVSDAPSTMIAISIIVLTLISAGVITALSAKKEKN